MNKHDVTEDLNMSLDWLKCMFMREAVESYQ